MKNEREINLKGLLIYILKHWRSIIIAIIVGGLVLFAFGKYRGSRSSGQTAAAADLPTPEEVLEEMLEEEAEEDSKPMSEVERSAAYSAYLNIINYYEALSYMESTPYMQIDGAHAPVTTISVSLSPSINDNNSAIVYSYRQLLNGGELHRYISRELGLQIDNWEKLITVTDNINSEVASANGIFSISVVYTDEKTCKSIAECIIRFMEEKQPELIDLYGYFDVNIIDNGTEIIYNSTVIAAQRDRKTSAQNYYSSVVNQLSAFTEKQLDFYDDLLDDAEFDSTEQKALVNDIKGYIIEERERKHEEAMKDAEEAIAEAVEAASAPVSARKYLIIGFLLGAFVMIVIHACKYIFANRTDIYDDVRSIYGAADLGHIPADSARKRFLSFVDGWILKLRNRTFRQTRQDAVGICSVGINMLAEKDEISEIAVVSCGREFAGDTDEQNVIKSIGERVESAIVLENILDDAAAMNRLASSDGAVIVSRSGATSRNDICKLIDIVKRQGIRLLGVVTAD